MGQEWTASSKITFHNSPSFVDYLHGDVDDEQAWVACRYEYARESRAIWDAAKERDDERKKSNSSCEKAWQKVAEQNPWEWYSRDSIAWLFLFCGSFPQKDWNELRSLERKAILIYETRKVPPLFMPDVRSPLGRIGMAWAMLDEFKALADKNKVVVENVLPGIAVKPMQIVPAVVSKGGSIHYCLFKVDFSESEDHLSDRFNEWLKLPAIKELWQGHKKERTGMTSEALHARKIWRSSEYAYDCLIEVDLSARKGDLIA